MRFIYLLILPLLFSTFQLAGQSAPITIDGQFDEWNDNLSSYSDPDESVSGVDLIAFQVSNDEHFLFLKLVMDTELNLKEDDPIAHNIYLYIDADNNEDTGLNVQPGIGTELGINFSNKSANFYGSSTVSVGFTEIQFRMGPTVTSKEFEIAIGRDVLPDNINELFTSPTIKILFKNWNNGDIMPNENEVFNYTFDETPVPEFTPVSLNKESDDFIRIVAYNTLWNGLEDAGRVYHFGKVIKALNPDVIGFSECYDTFISTVESLMNTWIPLDNGHGWYVVKKGDLITASRWPILQSWPFVTRQFPVLIDLPDNFNRDLLYTNTHLSCCANNEDRQLQIDEYVNFMLQLKAGGGGLGFTTNTPFVYGGDLNLVGYAEQLNTLLTGEIKNINSFGEGGPMDWDDSDLADVIPIQSDKRMAYTWRNDNSVFPPGRLDFIIYSDAVMNVEKSYVLQTEVMPQDRLQQNDLDLNNTVSASDHFPVVADFTIDVVDAVVESEIPILEIKPNPVSDELNVQLSEEVSGELVILDALGRVVKKAAFTGQSLILDVSELEGGIYFLTIDQKGKPAINSSFIKA